MTEAAGSPFGVVQHFHRLPDDLAVSRDHHLADTLPVIDGKRFGREVYQDYADLAAIVRIDSTGVFSNVMPCFNARPLRGRICAS